MKFNKFGFVFKYHGDTITLYWPWRRRSMSNLFYHSLILRTDFNNFRDYWQEIGQLDLLEKIGSQVGKLYGFDYLDILKYWSKRVWANECIAILSNVNYEKKGPGFWLRLSARQRGALLKDLVILKCSDMAELREVVSSIPHDFAEALGMYNGEVVISNEEIL